MLSCSSECGHSAFKQRTGASGISKSARPFLYCCYVLGRRSAVVEFSEDPEIVYMRYMQHTWYLK